jgi:TonB family protein
MDLSRRVLLGVALGWVLMIGCQPKPPVKPGTAAAPPPAAVAKPAEDPAANFNSNLPMTRTQEDINATVASRMGGVGYCYEKHVGYASKIKGQVVIEFFISTDGSVRTVNVVQSDIDNPAFLECIKDRILHWRFDPINPKGEEPSVVFPFDFGN